MTSVELFLGQMWLGPEKGLPVTAPTRYEFSRCPAGARTVYNAVAMSLSRTVRLLLALVSGVALALAYPSFNIPLLGWIAPALLIVAVVGERPRFAFLLGWLQGAAYYGLSLPWFYTVMRQYGPLPAIQAGAVFALVIVATSLFHAAFAAAIAWIGEGAPERACLAAPFLWVTMEFAMMHLPAIGFPWDLLGYVAAGNLVFVQLTAITGIFGLSLVVASYSALAAWVVLQMSQRKQGGVTIWIAANVLLIVIAGVGPRYIPHAPADHIAHLVQTNFPVSNGYPSNWMQVHAAEMDQLEAISIGAAQKVPGIVVWPEVPAPFSLQDGNFQARALRIARGAGNGFLVGVIDWKPLAGRRDRCEQQRRAARPEWRARFHVRQDSSCALQRVRAVEEFFLLRQGFDRTHWRFSAWHAIQSGKNVRRAVQRLHLLRSDFSE